MSEEIFDVEHLNAYRDSAVSTAFMEFNDAVTTNPDALFVFCEGQDSDYYYPRLKQYSRREIESIRCSGKQKVIDVHDMIVKKHEYDKYHKGYFIDRDFDTNDDIQFVVDYFITDGYSIENYYLSDACMQEFLKQTFNFHAGDNLLESVMSDYRIKRQKYFEAILLFNAWYCALRRKYGHTVSRVCLGEKMPRGFLNYDSDTCETTSNYDMEKIYEHFQIDSYYSVADEEIEFAIGYLKSDLQKNLRGKYGLSFLCQYIATMNMMFKSDSTYKTHYRKIDIQWNTIMSILSIYADTENNLVDYIKRVSA